MSTKMIRTLVKKEMLDVLRDKKTVIMMLVIPVILYPLIFIGAMQVMSMVTSSMEQQTYRIAVAADDNGVLRKKLENSSQEKEKEKEKDEDFVLVDAQNMADYEQALQNSTVDVYISGASSGNQTQYQIYYLSSSENSSYAANLVENQLEDLSKEISKQRVEAAGLDVVGILEPVSYEKKDTASSEQSLGSIMGSVLPFMLIISLLMGTMYPAIDTTAGERERGTLETMLTLPVTNRQLIVGKFITVAVIGMVSALLNILSMGFIAFYIYQVMGMQMETVSFDAGLFLPAIVVSVLAVFAFSLFISAATMCVTSFAKSYKEANNYITPFMLVVMLTGYIGFIPNIELTQTMAVVPVANICLLIKNLLLFQLDQGVVALVLMSNLAYAVLAILFLSKIYDSEAILFGDSKSSFQIFENRKNLKKGGVPTVSDAWFIIALTLVVVLYAGSIMQIKYGIRGLFGTQMLLFAVPFLVVLYTKKDLRLTYGLQGTRLSDFFAAAILSVGLFLFNMVLSFGLIALFPEGAQRVSDSFSAIMDGGALVNLLVIALTPAVCEELLFRGVVFHSLKEKSRPFAAMVVTAAIFGAYHLSLVKFIPTGLLGFALCYVVYRTGSIFPAMLMHFMNNACSVLLSEYPALFKKIVPGLYRRVPTVSDVLLLAGAGLLLIGIGLMLLNYGSGAKNKEAGSMR